MRVSATQALTPARDSQSARRAGPGGFSLSEAGQTAARISTGHLQAIGGIDALVALQGLHDPAERRRRAVRKGRSALDALDALKLGLVAGELDPSALQRLRAAAADLTADLAADFDGNPEQSTGDRGLDGVLSQIDLRLQVEIAKLSRR
jgi:hypothetical protein